MQKMALSVSEAAEVLGVAPSTVRLMAQSGQLRSVRVGTGKGKLLIPVQAIEELLGEVA